MAIEQSKHLDICSIRKRKGRYYNFKHRILWDICLTHFRYLFLSFFFSLSLFMIVYLIINKLGTIIYQSNTKTNTNENQRIRYLPLLVIKDLVKASFYQNFEYIKLQDKTIVFEEVYIYHLYRKGCQTYSHIEAKSILCCLHQKKYTYTYTTASSRSNPFISEFPFWTTMDN